MFGLSSIATKLGIYAVVALAVIAYVLTLRIERDHARAELAGAQAKIAALADANQKCAADVKTQNAAVASLKSAADQALTDARNREAVAIEDAVAAEQLAQVRGQNLAKAEIAPGCEGAVKYLRDQAGGLASW